MSTLVESPKDQQRTLLEGLGAGSGSASAGAGRSSGGSFGGGGSKGGSGSAGSKPKPSTSSNGKPSQGSVKAINVSESKMYQLGDHFNKHGRGMGYESKKAYDAAAKEFATKYKYYKITINEVGRVVRKNYQQ